MFKKVLVAVDGSEHARAALELATRMAAEAAATEPAVHLTVLNVISSPHVIATELDVMPLDPRLYEGLADRLRDAAREWMEAWVAQTVPTAVPCTLVLHEGYPPDEIVGQAAAGGHDLLVMGAHGRAGLRGALVGSVTGRVLRHSPIPVLVTR